MSEKAIEADDLPAQEDDQITAESLEAGFNELEAGQEADQEKDPILEEAIQMGYNPDGVEGKANLTPEEFVGRGKLYDKIHRLEKSQRMTNETVELMRQREQGLVQDAKERALAELKVLRDSAAEMQDIQEVVRLSDQIAEKQKEKEEPDVYQPTEAEKDRAVQANTFMAENSWYGVDETRTLLVDAIAAKAIEVNPDITGQELLNKITEADKKTFQSTRRRTQAVAPASRSAPTSARKLTSLSEDQQGIAKQLIRNGVFKNEEDYMKAFSE